MIQDFEEYEKMLAIYLEGGEEACELGIFDEPEKPEGYDDYKMQKDAEAYEQYLQMFIDYGADAHARHLVGEPKKPETYDAYKLKQFKYYEYHLQCFNEAKDAYERNFIDEPEKPEGYDEYKAAQEQLLLQKQKKAAQKTQKPSENYEVKGYEFDAEGIPRYLTADDYYNGIENPEWTKKHTKIETKSYIAKEDNTSEQPLENKIKNGGWHNYDEDGVPEFLNYDDRYNGVVNPEWEKKHGKKD